MVLVEEIVMIVSLPEVVFTSRSKPPLMHQFTVTTVVVKIAD